MQSHFGSAVATYPDILGGVPLLIYKGIIIPDMSPEKAVERFMTMRFARTAIGIKKDTLTIVVVDGSSTFEKDIGVFRGLSIPELAQYFQEAGSFYAVNLDGGGSATMVIKGKVVNSVKNNERPVSEALVFRRK